MKILILLVAIVVAVFAIVDNTKDTPKITQTIKSLDTLVANIKNENLVKRQRNLLTLTNKGRFEILDTFKMFDGKSDMGFTIQNRLTNECYLMNDRSSSILPFSSMTPAACP